MRCNAIEALLQCLSRVWLGCGWKKMNGRSSFYCLLRLPRKEEDGDEECDWAAGGGSVVGIAAWRGVRYRALAQAQKDGVRIDFSSGARVLGARERTVRAWRDAGMVYLAADAPSRSKGS